MARRATSLGPKPSLFVFWGGFLGCFFLEKGICCLFLSLSLCFSFAFFGLPLSQSLSLSLSLVLFFFFLFLSLFCFLLVAFFVSFFPFVSSLLLFHERNNIKTFNCYFFCSSIFLFFFGFLSCFFFSNLFLLSLFLFSDLKLCFIQHECFWFQNKQKTCLVKRGLQQNVFFFQLVFAKCEKLSFFLGGGGLFLPKKLVFVKKKL